MPGPIEPSDSQNHVSSDPPPSSDPAQLDYAGPLPLASAVSNALAGRLDWAAILVRLGALWCLLTSTSGLFYILEVTDDRDRSLQYWLASVGPYAIYALVGIVLWATAAQIARRMLADVPPLEPAQPDVASSGPSRSEAQAVAFSVLGVVFVVLALQHLPEVFESLSGEAPTNDSYTSTVNRHAKVQFAIEFGAGLLLFLGSRGLANIWQRLTAPRYGQPEPSQGSDQMDRPT